VSHTTKTSRTNKRNITSVNQSITTHFYSAICGKCIRGAWQDVEQIKANVFLFNVYKRFRRPY